MAWRHRLALILLLALTGMPVGGTVCAVMCSVPQTASHHGGEAACELSDGTSAGPQLIGQSAHDCMLHGGSMRQVATPAAGRAGVTASSQSTALPAPGHLRLAVRPDGEDLSGYTAPPGTDPPTRRPLVLRV